MALKKTSPDLLGDELVVEEDEKNWKGICIAFFVISSIVSMIVGAIIFLTPDNGDSKTKHPKLSLRDIVEGRDILDNHLFDGRWITNTELVYKTSDGNVISYNAFNNNTQILVSNVTMKQYLVQKYSFSADRKYVLFVTDIKPVFHYSFTAQYKIFNVSDQQVYSLEAPSGEQQLQFAEWGTKGSQLLFIHENNIYYQHSVGELIQQITKSGSITNGIYHGITDWLYGERILRSNRAIYWAPDGTRLCFATFDDSKVDQIIYPKYGDYRDNSNSYPKMSSLRFPKPGSFNPSVELWVVELNQQRLSSMASANRVLPPREMMISEESEYYLTSVTWIDNQKFIALWINRYQNYSVLSLCTEKHAWICEKHLDEHSDSLGFVDIIDPPLITADKRHYLIRLPMPSDHGTFKQIVMVTINGRVKNFLTQGNSDVVKILAHKQEIRTVYYLGASPNMQRHLYSIPDIHSSIPRLPVCLTCNHQNDEQPLEHHIHQPRHSFLSSEYVDSDQMIRQPRKMRDNLDDVPMFAAAVNENNGNEINELLEKNTQSNKELTSVSSTQRNCTFHDAEFSVFSDYLILHCLGPDVPFSEIRTVDGNQIVLRSEPNSRLEELVHRRAYPRVQNMRIPLEHNTYADVQIFLPPSLKTQEHFKFPLIIQVLPTDAHSNQLKDQVTTRLDFNLPIYLTSNRNTVTARLALNVMHGGNERRPRLASSKIFSPNSLNQLLQSAISILKHRLTFINEDKTAMIGWGIGAYLVGQLASQPQFNCSILVAPITNWMYVDSFTGERLFGNPWIEGNLVSYERADLAKKALQFKPQNLFILHGTADDEVHLQHSFSLMKALNEEGVIYRSQIYPDGNHYLEDVRLHLFKSIESFLIDYFELTEFSNHYEAFMKMKSFKTN